VGRHRGGGGGSWSATGGQRPATQMSGHIRHAGRGRAGLFARELQPAGSERQASLMPLSVLQCSTLPIK